MALKLNNPLASQLYNFPSSARPPISTFRSPKFLCLASSSPALSSKEVESLKKPFTPPKEVHVQVLHSMPPQKIEIFKSMEDWAEQNLLTHLKDVEKSWQPQDFLPDPASDGFEDQVRELRERARELPDDYFVVLVGDMITEEALPTYQTMLNTLDGVRDETGASPTSWAIWTRAWTAEENRHGDLLNKYLYLSGRVDMRQIEKTIQYLIGSGMDPRTENNPYLGFIYTSFQERATFISHGNTARQAKEHGDLKLAQICGTIAADEKRHETAYTKIVEKLFEIDPDGTVVAPPPEMDIQPPALLDDDPSSATWDWGDLLDFAVDDDQLLFSPLPPAMITTQSESYPSPDESGSGSDRVRKRDPRLLCSNFVQGMVPCSCPELDQKLEEAELPKKKRVRGGSGVVRCQVPGCEVDISELKGYHKRHRVCLTCANASSVVLEGVDKRYCQQCGKFHVLPDFDEGKRSCRRKLERHNNRRKRKPVDKGGVASKQQQVLSQNDNSVIDVDDGKDNTCSSDQRVEQEASLISEDRNIPTQGSVPFPHSIDADNFVPVTASGEAQPDEGTNDTKFEPSPSCGDNKSAYSTVCPTGRISFKLYDWNPAEFPRRLRHQIFQWLATMPVELEGYIRPGCTILTVFIAMPEIMWAKLSKDPVAYLDEFILKPGKMLFGRGSMTVYLNNMIFRLLKGGTTLKRVDVKLESPKLQFVYPTCFEAGKPMELIVCGLNLVQPKCRFLVSFSGKYLPHNYSVVPAPDQDGKRSCNNKLYRITIVNSDPNLFGPAFVEVENESGLSNFIPLIIGDKAICSEMKLIEQKFNATLFPEEQDVTACYCSLTCRCRDFKERQSTFTGLLLDIAWSVKVPSAECTELTVNRCQIKRYNRVLNYLKQSSNSPSILGNILHNLETLVKKMDPGSLIHSKCDCDVRLLHENMNLARKQQSDEDSKVNPVTSACCCESSFHKDKPSRTLNFNQDPEAGLDCKERIQAATPDTGGKETDPLLEKEIVMNVSDIGDWPRKSCIPIHSAQTIRSRQTAFLITTFVVCFAVCAVIYHPNKVAQLAVAIRTRLAHKL